VDPVTVGAVLAAVSAGGGEALAGRAWDGLAALVRRPFRHGAPAAASSEPGEAEPGQAEPGRAEAGEAELAALAAAPGDQGRALVLARVLAARADADEGFAAALAEWLDQARQVVVSGDVTNTISGGIQHGPVLQGRDFTGLTFGAPPSAAPPVGEADPP
jgi:hypothetical protein